MANRNESLDTRTDAERYWDEQADLPPNYRDSCHGECDCCKDRDECQSTKTLLKAASLLPQELPNECDPPPEPFKGSMSEYAAFCKNGKEKRPINSNGVCYYDGLCDIKSDCSKCKYLDKNGTLEDLKG